MYAKTIGVVFAMLAAIAGSAAAQCGGGHGAARLIPAQSSAEAFQRAWAKALVAPGGSRDADASAPSLVGIWDVMWFTAPTSLFGPTPVWDEGYDQFHADGTEILNDTPYPQFGNICLGVYVQTGTNTYRLHHVFWNWDSTTQQVVGRGEWNSEITLDPSGNR